MEKTKSTKILFLSAAAGITFALGILTGDHFGQMKGYSAGARDAYCEFRAELDSLSAEYRQAIDDYRSRIVDVSSGESSPGLTPHPPACNCKERKHSARRPITLTDSLIREFRKASKDAAREARDSINYPYSRIINYNKH